MMRLLIGGAWEPHDFSEVLDSIEGLYYTNLMINQAYFATRTYPVNFLIDTPMPLSANIEEMNSQMLRHVRSLYSGEHRMTVHKLVYSSPGAIDFIGIGKAFESVANIVNRICSYFIEKPFRTEELKRSINESRISDIEVEKSKETLMSLKIKNAQNLLELSRDVAKMNEIEKEIFCQKIIPMIVQYQEPIARCVSEGKVSGAVTEPIRRRRLLT